jgi:hypothetical protein
MNSVTTITTAQERIEALKLSVQQFEEMVTSEEAKVSLLERTVFPVLSSFIGLGAGLAALTFLLKQFFFK